jgi:hypothetical protein
MATGDAVGSDRESQAEVDAVLAETGVTIDQVRSPMAVASSATTSTLSRNSAFGLRLAAWIARGASDQRDIELCLCRA